MTACTYKEGKMRKIMKKTAAVTVAAAMAAVSFTGCSLSASGKSANSMFTTMKAMSEEEKANVEVNADINVAGTKAEIKLSGVKDGNATSCSANISAAGLTFDLQNLFVFTDDVIYINYKEITDEFSTYIDAAGIDLSQTGITSDWLSLEMKGAFDYNGAFSDDLVKALDTAYGDLIEKDGNEYSITVSEKDSVQSFMDCTVKLLEENKDLLVSEALEKYNNYDMKDSINTLADQFIKALGDNGVDQDTLDELKSSLDEELEDAESEMTEDDLKSELDDLVDEINDSEAEDLDGRVKYSIGYDKKVYTQTVDMNIKDDSGDMVANITSTVTPDKKASVEIPSDSQSLIDVIAKISAGYMTMMSQYDINY